MASSFFSSALVGSCHATVSPFPLGEDGGLIPLIRRPEDNKYTGKSQSPWRTSISYSSQSQPPNLSGTLVC